MKTTRYKFEQAVQEVTENTATWLLDEYKAILESDKDFTRKADYIGLSILSLDTKVSVIDEEIKELQLLKQQLKRAKDIAQSIGAKVFTDNGITKLEGAAISSITVTPSKIKETKTLEILNQDAVLQKGYAYLVIDENSLKADLETTKGRFYLAGCARFNIEETTSEPKLRVNKRKSKTNEVDKLEVS